MRSIQSLPRDYDLEYLKGCFSHQQKVPSTRQSLLTTGNQKPSVSDTTQQQQTTAHKADQLQSAQIVKKAGCKQDEPTPANSESGTSSDCYFGQIENEPSHYDKTQLEVNDSCIIPQASSLETTIKENTEQTSSSQTQELEDWLESVLD